MSEPKLTTPILLFLIAALCAALAWRVEWMPDWLRALFVLAGAILGMFGALAMLDWLAYHASSRLREFQYARSFAVIAVAQALRGLSPYQTEIVAKYGMVQVDGRLGENQINWTVRAPGGDLPWEFMADFLVCSKATNPHLWPVRRHDRLSQEFGWENAEHLCQLATDLIVQRGWAEKATGPYAAMLTIPYEDILEFWRISPDDA